jgi:hypothetical protein
VTHSRFAGDAAGCGPEESELNPASSAELRRTTDTLLMFYTGASLCVLKGIVFHGLKSCSNGILFLDFPREMPHAKTACEDIEPEVEVGMAC